jgi:predicted transcriptional regulator
MNLTSPKILLLSIHQKYASLIFEGSKTVELRRVKPRLSKGDLILVYVTSPEESLFGLVEVEKVVEKPHKQLWDIVEDKAGIDYQTFQNYYKNSACGFAIFLGKTHLFKHPIKLNILREKWPNFHPPQSYRYIRENELDLLQKITNYDILGICKLEKIYQTELLYR